MRVTPLRAVGTVALAAVVAVVLYLVVVMPLQGQWGADAGEGEPPPQPEQPVVTGDPESPSGEPMPTGDLPGWRQVFTEDFSGDQLSDQWIAYEGQPIGDPGGYFLPSRISVGDGMLTVGAWPDPERDGLYASGGVSNRNTYSEAYGKYEIRFRADQGRGIAYALVLWPETNEYPPEIDIAEDNGRDRDRTYGVLHPADLEANEIEEFSTEGDFTQWHTAGIEWTPERLVFTLDGEPWATVEGDQVPDEPMHLALQTQAWYCGHTWQACPDETTPERVDLQVDWVTIYEPA